MKEFLLNNYSLLTHLTEFFAALTGVVLYRKYKTTEVKYFIWFLIYLAVFDFIGEYKNYVHNNGFLSFLKGTIFETNHWLSTLYWKVGSILFFVFYYHKILKSKIFKSIIKTAGYTFFIISILIITFNWDAFFYKFFPLISILGAVIVFLCSMFYFIEMLQSDNVYRFYKLFNFYVSICIFIWWLIITPLVFYDLYHTNGDWNYIILKWQIYLFANIFMYGTFTFGLIVSSPENEKN